MAPYSFPILEKKAILKDLLDLGVEFPEQDLMKPTPEAIKNLYEKVFNCVTSVSKGDFQQPVLCATDRLEYPELHEQSIGILALSRSITKMMTVSGIGDFTRKDIYKPDINRVITQLSAVINYAKYRQEKGKELQEAHEQADALMDRTQQLADANMDLMARLQEIKDERAVQQPLVDELRAEDNELLETIRKLNDEHSSLQTEVRILKQSIQDTANKDAAEKEQLQNAQKEVESLRDKVAESPEKIQVTVEEYHTILENEKAVILEGDSRLRGLQSQLDCLTKVEHKVRKCVARMEEVEAKALKQKALSKTLKETKAKIAATNKLVESLKDEREHLKKKIHSTQEWLNKQRENTTRRRANLTQSLQQASMRAREKEEQSKMKMDQAEEKKRQALAIRLKMEQLKASSEQEQARLKAKFHAVHHAATKYMVDMALHMEKPPAIPPFKPL